MAALMKQHGHSLNDELLRTLLCEAEAVVNSRPLTLFRSCEVTDQKFFGTAIVCKFWAPRRRSLAHQVLQRSL